LVIFIIGFFLSPVRFFFFFFQAEDGIRDGHVTGVQTCALPIYATAITAFGSRIHAHNPLSFAGRAAVNRAASQGGAIGCARSRDPRRVSAASAQAAQRERWLARRRSSSAPISPSTAKGRRRSAPSQDTVRRGISRSDFRSDAASGG